MKAVSGALPTGDGWAFEIKWDGMRVTASVDGGAVSAISTNGLDATSRFPELADLVDALSVPQAVLDGEVVVLDAAGRSDFGLLQHRMHVAEPAKVARLAAELPVRFVVFDVLELDGQATAALSYVERRRLLEQAVTPTGHIMVPAYQVGDGEVLFAAAAAAGLEGLIAKRLDSPYEVGRRSSAWRKCKVRNRQEVVIGGWASGEGSRSAGLGSLLVGVHDPDATGRPLRYAGRVGTGLTEQALKDLAGVLGPKTRRTTPFEPPPPRIPSRTVTWVDPDLVCEVEFGEWTAQGRLRHPSYLGLRIDKDPGDVVREASGSAR